jgi:hypothetical protein
MSGTDWRVIESSLRARGLWDADGVHEKVRARLCPKCGAPVMVGLADGAPVAVDPVPLNRIGEASALLAGRTTFALRYLGRYELSWRSAEHITGTPAGTNARLEVVAEHMCNSLPAETSLGPPMQDRTQSRAIPAEPNF